MSSDELTPSTTTDPSSAVQAAPAPTPQLATDSTWHGLACAIVESRHGLIERLQHDPQAHLELVALAASAKAETAVLLAGAVRSARGAGCTWSQIGDVLGVTRQAAQQQYGDDAPLAAAPAGPVESMTLAPLTAFNEMAVLARAGEYGWHSVAYGPFFHRVERDTRPWEHARTFLGARPHGDGWQAVGAGWAWWSYWARPLDAPALGGNPSATDLVDNRILR